MAVYNITQQPTNNRMCSTLVPLRLSVFNNDVSTTNIIASCWYWNNATSAEVQMKGKFILAPSLTNADYFNFDASEIFNSLTKYTLNDMPNNTRLGSNAGTLNYLKNWTDVATWKVRVKFQREYLDATTGLIVLETTTKDSNWFYVHEGCPETNFLTQAVKSNGTSGSIFDFLEMNWDNQASCKRWLTNYPIKRINNGLRRSNVKIHKDEQYLLNFFPKPSAYDNCDGSNTYKLEIYTYGDTQFQTPFQAHDTYILESRDFTTIAVGFRDIQNAFTPSAAEGNTAGNLFGNVNAYRVQLHVCNQSGNWTLAGTEYRFIVDRKCKKNSGYLRFCFKNILGGFDLVTSEGEYKKKTKNKFEQFEKSTGFFGWTNPMDFGDSNWSNYQSEKFSVTTHPMNQTDAEYFAQMFMSTNVYLRVAFTADDKVVDSDLAYSAFEQPYYFMPIKIDGGTITMTESKNNLQVLKFSFEKAIGQRNPRY